MVEAQQELGEQEGVGEEDQQLRCPAHGHHGGTCTTDRLDVGWSHRSRLNGRRPSLLHDRGSRSRHSERRRESSDRGMPVDVPHRHRRQVGPLAHTGAEVRHHQRVDAQVVEEVAVRRHVVSTDEIG
jgi:hypothetical protein